MFMGVFLFFIWELTLSNLFNSKPLYYPKHVYFHLFSCTFEQSCPKTYKITHQQLDIYLVQLS